MNTLVTNRYVNAISKLDNKSIDSILSSLSEISNAFNSNEKFKSILKSSTIHYSKQLDFVLSCLPKIDAKSTNVLKLLAQKHRLDLIPTLYKELKLKLEKDKNIYFGEIRTNIELSKKDIQAYEKAFGDKMGIKLSLEVVSKDFDGVKIEVPDFGASLIFSKKETKKQIINHILKGIGV